MQALQVNNSKIAEIEGRVDYSDKKIEALVVKGDTTEAYVKELHEKVDSVDFEISALRNQLKNFETADTIDHHAQCNSCAYIDKRVETLERQNLLSNLVLDGLPSLSTYSRRENLPELIIQLAKLVKVNLQTEDITSCYRIPVRRRDDTGTAKSRSSPVIIKFRQQTTRDQLYFAYLQKRNLKLSDLIPEFKIASRLYLSEHITAECKLLLRRCAALKKKKIIMQYHTRNGKLFFIKRQGDFPTMATRELVSELENRETE